MTVNVHKGLSQFNRRFILPELRSAIREAGADVVCMQEIIGEHKLLQEKNSATWPSTTQYEYLADTVWDNFIYGRNAVYDEGHHGNAILSKYPITCWDNLDISSRGVEKRGLLHCCIELPSSDSKLHVLCTHLSLAERNRQQEIGRIIEFIDTLPDDEALVLVGDFNDWRLEAHKRILKETPLVEIFNEVDGAPARTFPAILPMLRLDRIYIKPSMKFTLKKIDKMPWNRLSDHRPLAAELRLKNDS